MATDFTRTRHPNVVMTQLWEDKIKHYQAELQKKTARVEMLEAELKRVHDFISKHTGGMNE